MDATSQSQIAVFPPKDNIRTEDSKDNNNAHVWTNAEVEALLKLYVEREVEFKNPTTKKKTLWQEVCIEMNRQGFLLNPMQCECKLKNMKAMYRKSLDRGIDPAARCPFYEQLYDIFGLAPPLRIYPEGSRLKKTQALKRIAENNVEITLSGDQIAQIGLVQLQQQQNGMNEAVPNKRQTLLAEVPNEPENTETDRRSYEELVDELLVLRRTLEQERQLREEERKKSEEERRKSEEERDRRAKEFHEERMAMLNSMNKLISSLGTRG